MRALRAATFSSVFLSSTSALWTRVYHQSNPSSIFRLCSLESCSQNDGTNYIDFDQLPKDMEEYHMLIVWNGVESMTGRKENYLGTPWDYALEWTQDVHPLAFANHNMRPQNVKMWNSGRKPYHFQGLSKSASGKSLFDSRVGYGMGYENYGFPIGAFESRDTMKESLMLAHPDPYAPQKMLFAESIELYVELPKETSNQQVAENEITWIPELTPENYPCPTTQCWTFDEKTNSCVLKRGCTDVQCDATSISASFSEGAFGNNVNIDMEGILPEINANRGFTYECPLGECGMTHEVIGNKITGYMLEFKLRIAPEEEQRHRRQNVITLGLLKIVTEESLKANVDLLFKCTYPMGIDLSNDSNSKSAVAISGHTTSSFGALDDGFNIIIGDAGTQNTPLTLGKPMKVSVTWDVLLSDITFHVDDCKLEHGPITVFLVKGACYSSALSVAKIDSDIPTISSFTFRTFMIAGQRGAQQSIACKIKVCQNDNCNEPTTDDQCPSDRGDGPFMYTVDGSS